MVGCWGSRDCGLVGISVAAVLLVGDLSSCGMGATCSFGGLLVVGPGISPGGWVCSLCFHLWGVSWFFLGDGIWAFALGNMSDGAGRVPLLNTYMCLH